MLKFSVSRTTLERNESYAPEYFIISILKIQVDVDLSHGKDVICSKSLIIPNPRGKVLNNIIPTT